MADWEAREETLIKFQTLAVKFYVGYLKVTKLPLDWADERSREQIEAASKGGRGSRLLHCQVQLGDAFHHLDIDQL